MCRQFYSCVLAFARLKSCGSLQLCLMRVCDLSHPTPHAVTQCSRQQHTNQREMVPAKVGAFNPTLKGSVMRSLITTAILFLTTTSVFALDRFDLPEPDTMFLLGLAGAGMWLALRNKDK